jgi:hypothetical protein
LKYIKNNKNKMAQETDSQDYVTEQETIDITDEYQQLLEENAELQKKNIKIQEENTELRGKLRNFEFYKKLFIIFVILFIISIISLAFQNLYLNNYYRGEILKGIEEERNIQNKNLDTIIQLIKKNSETIMGFVNSLHRPPVTRF